MQIGGERSSTSTNSRRAPAGELDVVFGAHSHHTKTKARLETAIGRSMIVRRDS
jgi:hypothetical protein